MQIVASLRGILVRGTQRLLWFILSRITFRSDLSLSYLNLHSHSRIESPNPINKEMDSNVERAGSLTMVASIEKGTPFAAYSFRFVAMPLDSFYEGVKEYTTLSRDKFAREIESDLYLRTNMFNSFFKKANLDSLQSGGIEYLKEEMFHHEHLKETALSSFSQCAALIGRYAQIYIALKKVQYHDKHRLLSDLDYKVVLQFLINLTLSTQELKALSMPVIEGYARFANHDEKEKIIQNYNGPTAVAAEIFANIQSYVANDPDSLDTRLIKQVAKDVLNVPLIASGLLDFSSYFVFRERLQNPLLRPLPRLRIVSELFRNIDDDKLEVLAGQIRKALSIATPFECRWTSSFAWLITRKFIPPQLLSMIFLRLLLTRQGIESWGRVFANILFARGEQVEQVSNREFPGLRVYGLTGTTMAYDPFNTFFQGRSSTRNQVTSFEFMMLPSGEDFRYIQLQTILLRYVTTKIRGSTMEPYVQFMFKWLPMLDTKRGKIETWLHWIDKESGRVAQPIRAALARNEDPFMGEQLTTFLSEFEDLFWLSEKSLKSNDWKDDAWLVYRIGDGLYMHGL